MKENQSWQCPYCGHHQVLLEKGYNNDNLRSSQANIVQISEHNKIGLVVNSIACLNSTCQKLTLTVGLKKGSTYRGHLDLTGQIIKKWSLLPDSIAKPQPDYIPLPIRKDYEEACKIAHLSPNASAVLARRCLQSMIRDFCNIKENTLHKEIEQLKTNVEERKNPSVTEESIQAIDNIRKMGNIGAHMEKPTGILIDIEPEEAELLIQLIETLFKDWYVARNERQQRLKNIQAITTKKEQQKIAEEKTKNTKAPH